MNCEQEIREPKTASKTLINQIIIVLEEQGVTLSDVQVASFAWHIQRAERIQRAWKHFLQTQNTLVTLDILPWIVKAERSGNLDEALWRGFLAGHFGRSSANPQKAEQVESAGRLLCGFGNQPMWTWSRISSNLPAFKSWLWNHKDDLATLQFGSHRKYESKKPSTLFGVIDSFVKWVEKSGKTPRKAFAVDKLDAPETKFDLLYQSMKSIQRFGRTACFDTLYLLGDMGILSIKPGSCYLCGATGPLLGARKIWGARRPVELTFMADQAARRLGLPIEVFEDALCNWQK